MPKIYPCNNSAAIQILKRASFLGTLLLSSVRSMSNCGRSHSEVFNVLNHLAALEQCHVIHNEHGAAETVAWLWLTEDSLELVKDKSIFELHLSDFNEGRILCALTSQSNSKKSQEFFSRLFSELAPGQIIIYLSTETTAQVN